MHCGVRSTNISQKITEAHGNVKGRRLSKERNACRFTVAEWLTHLAATLEVMGSRPSLGDIQNSDGGRRHLEFRTRGFFDDTDVF